MVKKNQIDNYIQSKFQEYYSKFSINIQPPIEIGKREFGFLLFTEKHMIRHKNFNSIGDLKSFVRTIVPSDVYYSAAYYVKPEEGMDKKGWLGADLVFDIDADHLYTPCKSFHDQWKCDKCGNIGKWPTPKKCPKCSAISFKEENWICELCLNKAKEETSKLFDILNDDLGFSRREISIYFTGHRGYHVHVRNNNVKTLGSDGRREIVDYIAGIGLDLDLITLENPASVVVSGWRYRIERELERLLIYADENELFNLGFKGKLLKDLQNLREKIKGGVLKNSVLKLIDLRFKNLFEAAVNECSVQVDSVVTTDIHRLVRLPGTLNRKTGLKVVEVRKLENFDPLKESLSLTGGEETVYIIKAPKFIIGDGEFGPYENEEKKLPIEAALMLICKGRAYQSSV